MPLHNGVTFGRRPKLTQAQRETALTRVAAGEPQKSIVASYNVSCSTISRLMRLADGDKKHA
ncbi:helix-turn-helix domain-containing protein [Bradyrhizobium canariense]|uniref:helix-turn-helix domain-containing protein n=1 Tax=Bradyrhizobium canariense TaxID=255045 RepID=UPI003D9B61F3